MTIARLKITLDDITPAVTRRVEVPLDITLSDLHLVIQAAMPWDNCHLYEFSARKIRWGIADDDSDWGDDGPLDARLQEVEDGGGEDDLGEPEGEPGVLPDQLLGL